MGPLSSKLGWLGYTLLFMQLQHDVYSIVSSLDFKFLAVVSSSLKEIERPYHLSKSQDRILSSRGSLCRGT